MQTRSSGISANLPPVSMQAMSRPNDPAELILLELRWTECQTKVGGLSRSRLASLKQLSSRRENGGCNRLGLQVMTTTSLPLLILCSRLRDNVLSWPSQVSMLPLVRCLLFGGKSLQLSSVSMSQLFDGCEEENTRPTRTLVLALVLVAEPAAAAPQDSRHPHTKRRCEWPSRPSRLNLYIRAPYTS